MSVKPDTNLIELLKDVGRDSIIKLGSIASVLQEIRDELKEIKTKLK